MTAMPRIDPDRLLSDLRTLRAIGAHGRGVVRPAFSATDMEARRWLKDSTKKRDSKPRSMAWATYWAVRDKLARRCCWARTPIRSPPEAGSMVRSA